MSSRFSFVSDLYGKLLPDNMPPKANKKYQEPLRRSARLQAQKAGINAEHKPPLQPPPPPPTRDAPEKEVPKARSGTQKRLSQEVEAPLAAAPFPKRPRVSPPFPVEDGEFEDEEFKDDEFVKLNESQINTISHWSQSRYWPRDYLEQPRKTNPFKTPPSLSSSDSSEGEEEEEERKQESEMVDESENRLTPSYVKNPRYEKLLNEAGIYMDNKPGIKKDCKALCKSLLLSEQPLPSDSLFRDDRFPKLLERLHSENEAKVVRDLLPLLIPFVEHLYMYGEEHLEHYVDHVSRAWTSCTLILSKHRPQPDYCAGYQQTMFTKDQLQKLNSIFRSEEGKSFQATDWMLFPFLTVEAKSGQVVLDTACRQNVHSASIAVQQVIQLYRAVDRQHELDRKILAFSVSHNHDEVRIYGHYAVIDGHETNFHRYEINIFNLRRNNGDDRWTSYRFIKNIYDIFTPMHIELIRSAVDQLPIVPSKS